MSATPVIPLRLTPPGLLGRLGGRRSWRLVERNLTVYRRSWPFFVSGLFEPLFYLLSITIGLGHLVGRISLIDHRSVAYATFVAPALLGASSMNVAIFDSTFGVFFKLKYAKVYTAVLSSPLGPADVARGEVTSALLRGFAYVFSFLVVMACLGDVASMWALLVLPAALLLGFAFSAVGIAASSFMRSWQDFDFVQLTSLPMFLFSATFYPLSAYPHWLQLVVQASPLYQGVSILRALDLGIVGPIVLAHAAYLAVMGLVGLRVATCRLSRLLCS